MSRPRQFAIAAGFVLLSLWVTWPLARHLDEALPGDLGDPLLNTWILGWVADRAAHGLSGLWNAPIFFPYRYTLAFSEHLLGIGVPMAPIAWLTGRPFVVYNLAFVASFALAGIGMWQLARRLTGCEDAALIAGAIFAFAPARLGQIGHLQVLMSGWMPLALLGLHRYLETGSRRALAAFSAAFIVQGLSNGYYIYFLAVPVMIVAVHAIAVRPSRTRLASGLAVSGVCILLVFAPIARVYYDVRHTYGFQRTEDEVSTFGADLGAYLHGNEALRPPIRIWRALPHFDKPGGPEGEIFPGLAAIALALTAFLFRRAPDDTGRLRTMTALYGTVAVAAVLLSMGADPSVWGVRLPVGGLYRALFAFVPGFNGLRVPARFSTVTLLALAVLAAVGFSRLAARLSASTRAALCAVTLVFVLLEGTGGAMPLAFLTPHGRPDRAAYNWVRDLGDGAVLELPAGELDTSFRTYQYEYQTLFHRRPIVNGASGYNSVLQAFLGSAASPLVESAYFGDGLRALRQIGVRTVVVHPQEFADPEAGAAIVERLKADLASEHQVSSEALFPGVAVYRLAEWRGAVADSDDNTHEGARRQIPVTAFTASASQVPDWLPRAVDGNIETRWVSGERQSGTEWIDIAFDAPRDVALVRILTSDRSLGDYPRSLVVEGANGAAAADVLYRGSVVQQLARGLVADPLHGPIDIALPPNRVSRLRLRQTGNTRVWFWAVDELMLFER